MKNYKLYIIIDWDSLKNQDILEVTKEVLRGGADIIQLRDKSSDDKIFLQNAAAIREMAKRYKRLFIINDRVDITHIIGADGVHLGQNDIPIEQARKILGKKIIGISAHSLKEAIIAEEKGAHYIGIGPIFKSKTKKRLSPIGLSTLSRVSKAVSIPFFAIGGISPENIAKVKMAGAGRVAVVSSAIGNQDVYRSVKRLKEVIANTPARGVIR